MPPVNEKSDCHLHGSAREPRPPLPAAPAFQPSPLAGQPCSPCPRRRYKLSLLALWQHSQCRRRIPSLQIPPWSRPLQAACKRPWSGPESGGALCCDATFVSPLSRPGQPRPGAADTDGAVLQVAERRKRSTYLELCRCGPQELVVLGSRGGGRWNGEACRFVHHLLNVPSHRAPPALRRAAAAGWSRRWWGVLGVAVQQAVASTARAGLASAAPSVSKGRAAP